MSIDRVSLPAMPGMVRTYADRPVLLPPTLGVVLGVTLFVTDAPTGGPVTVEFRNATGTGGDVGVISIPDGATQHYESINVPLDGTQTLYMSITAANGTPMTLSGFLELDQVSQLVYTELTTLERVKRELNLTSANATRDILLGELIAGASGLFIDRTGRSFTVNQVVAERIDGASHVEFLLLSQYPVLDVSNLRDVATDSLIDPAQYEVDLKSGRIYSKGLGWTTGTRNYEADYDAGFAAIPPGVVDAVTDQVCHAYNQTTPGGGRRSLESRSTGAGDAETFQAGATTPKFEQAIALYRRLD